MKAHNVDLLADFVQPIQKQEFLADTEVQARLWSRIIPEDNDVLLLGESTHGTEEFYLLRRQLTRYLVQHQNYKVLFIEAEWPDVYLVNQYITNARPDLSAKAALSQIQGFGKYMWQNYAFVELVEWMKDYNMQQNFRPEHMVYLFGIDCQQIFRSLKALYESLTEIDINLCAEIKSTLSFFCGFSSESAYASRTVTQIGSEQIPDTLQKLLSEFQWKKFSALQKQITKRSQLLELINIEQNLEVILNGEEYFRKRELEPAGSQVSWNTRDQHMTLSIHRIRERLNLVTHVETPSSPAKIIVWAHNSHIGDAAATARGGVDFTRNETWNLGQMVKQSIKNSFLLGFDTYRGTVTALSSKGSDDPVTHTLRPGSDSSVENLCHLVCEKKGCDAFFIDLDRNLSADKNYELKQVLSARMPHRYVGVNYIVENEVQSHYSQASLCGQYHGLIFIDDTSALRILPPEELKAAEQSKASGQSFSNKQGHRRLMQEYRQIMRHPIPGILVSPQEDNLFICHFVICCDYGDYEGGEYHGRLEFPMDYPMAPPRIFFYTPSGRFETETRICVSFSDYHPELWNPSWGIESVLVGIQSFMQEDSLGSLGSIQASSRVRRDLASKSHAFNVNNEHYRNLFLKKRMSVLLAETTEEKEEEHFCRYCRQSGGELLSPCKCKGGNKWVHRNCLAKWQYQAILSQSTHPKYQTGLERKCNVCFSEFNVQHFTREGLMLTFTGTEIANMIQVGCLLIATERSSAHNLKLMKQYSENRRLVQSLSLWTHNVFLISSITRTSPTEGKELIVGLGLAQEMDKGQAKRLSSSAYRTLKSLKIVMTYRHFVGGPVYTTEPFPVLALNLSRCSQEVLSSLPESFRRITFYEKEDIGLWSSSFENFVTFFSRRTEKRTALLNAISEVRIFWGCAGWDRIQLLGEIARGGWGLAVSAGDSWNEPKTSWSLCVKRAIIAGENDMRDSY